MKKPALDARLRAAAAYVRQDAVFADVGTDHAYLPLFLLSEGRIARAVCSDINEGPLQSAVRNSEKFGVRDKISFYLSDGVRNIPRDFDTLVCAGMGGDTMVSILSAAPWLQNQQYRLILQCQSKTPLLRKYLSDKGWAIATEKVLKDGKFLYTIMEILWQPDAPRLTPAQCYLSPVLVDSEDADAYRKWVIEGLRISTIHTDDAEKKQILQELEIATSLRSSQ